ncbi:MAG TPA: right-handed parallel beta-helix repeat-containing protein [Planctomycetota bacterium]|nr:right-handed parallel beta-helix repeat-containing protein [Planctomycetota bacterium]
MRIPIPTQTPTLTPPCSRLPQAFNSWFCLTLGVSLLLLSPHLRATEISADPAAPAPAALTAAPANPPATPTTPTTPAAPADPATPAAPATPVAPAAPATPAAPAEEPAIVTELRKESLDLIAKFIAAHTPTDPLDILLDQQTHQVNLTSVDEHRTLHYKEFGRAGSIPFEKLTPEQVAGLLSALMNDDSPQAAQAHLHSGLLQTLLGRPVQASAEIEKAAALDPDLAAVAAEKIKSLPKPPEPPAGPEPTAGATTTTIGGEAGVPPPSTDGPPSASGKDWPPPLSAFAAKSKPGLLGPVGVFGNPTRTDTLTINTTGLCENTLVDAAGEPKNLINIHADNVVVRNCEVRNSRHNGIQVYAKNVLIENCKIHHLGDGTLANSLDAHGITGDPHNLIIRNCEIHQVSGDCVQFDPARPKTGWTDVLIENCEFWTGPLDVNVAGFKKGQMIGENAVDTKNMAKAPRARLVIRNSVFHGFRGIQASGGDRAALNIKENVDCKIENCVFYDNGLSLRLRGPGTFGGSLVQATTCYFYDNDTAIRYEDKIQKLVLTGMAFSANVKTHYSPDSTAAADLQIRGDCTAPAFEQMVTKRTR